MDTNILNPRDAAGVHAKEFGDNVDAHDEHP
jgi:hypothetical protein